MFNFQFYLLYLLVTTTIIGTSSSRILRNLNVKMQAELLSLEKSNNLVKVLEKLDAPYSGVATLDLTIQIDENDPLLNFYIMERLNFILKNLEMNYANIINVNQPKPKREIFNVWVVDSYTNFLKIYSHAEANSRNKPGIYFIILYQTKNSSHSPKVKRIFKQMFDINVLNVLVMLKVQGQKYITYGYNPYTKDYCRKIRPFIVQNFFNKSLNNNGVWPNNINNFYGCSMRLYTWDVLPFMTFKYRKNGNVILGGFEGEILRVIAKRLNFTIRLLTDNANFYGDIDENGNATGPFFLLQKGFVDILMGSYFHSASRTKFLSETRTYEGTKLVAIVKKIFSSSNYTEWILDPFTRSAWLFIFIYTIKVLALILLLTPKAERSNALLNLIGTCLGVSQRISDTRNRCCFAIVVWAFGFLIIRSAYQAAIYDVYRVSHTISPPESLDELVAQNYKIYSSRFYNDSSSNIEVQAVALANGRHVLEMIADDNEHHSAGIVSYARLIHYILLKNKTDLYDIVKQPLYMQHLCAYFQPHSYLTHPFDSLIAQMQSSGLLQKWSRNKRGHGLNMALSKTEFRADLPEPMTLCKFKWLFYIITFLHILAICVFLLEIWALGKLRILRKLKEIF